MTPRGICIQIRRAADAASVTLRGLLSFHFFSPLPSDLPRDSFCIGLRMLLESFGLSCCLHVFCRVEFPTLGVFLRSRQPADPQADRPAGESAAIPSVEVCTSEVPTHFALLGGHLALLGIFLISFSLTPEFSSCIFQVRARVSPGSSLALCFGVHSRRTRLGYKQLRRKPICLLFVSFHSDQILLFLRPTGLQGRVLLFPQLSF